MTAYHCEIEQLSERTQRVHVTADDQRLSFKDVFEGWLAAAPINDVFTRLIADAPFEAVLWEMPPLTRAQLVNDYECVLIDSPELASLATNPAPFREYFCGSDNVVAFSNLGADALLIAPTPVPTGAQYTHLAAFCRTAPSTLSRRFWQRLAEVCLLQINDVPVWISTAGLGVGWLHARLDSYPKYYSHDPYRRRPKD